MDFDPAAIEAPYYEEIIVDGRVTSVAMLLPLCDGLVVCPDPETYASEKPQLVLYIRPSCPYCQKVTNFLSSQKKSIPTKDIGTDKNALNELIQKGGKRQVPCLMINGKPLYESNDIINWLKKHKGQY